ncbi:MAG: fructose-bisphosphate aldolase class I [Candidatus Poseidoniia archaeon]|nr:fructose-bisphosphate aldolase class I [Candidatus Poseidoniia archaeon]
MNKEKLAATARAIVSSGKGILAADESTPTMGKRLALIGQENTEANRRDFRQALFETESMEMFISGVILFEETLEQKTEEGTRLSEILESKGVIPGIKVDKGAHSMENSPSEKLTKGLDGLYDRCVGYHSLGARFAKWRAVITIGEGIPTDNCIRGNASALAKYAKACQDAELVPIVEPEVLMDGNHTVESCYEVSEKTFKTVFEELENEGVYLPGILLKPNMVISGKDCPVQGDINTVAEMTVKCLKASVPEDVPGIVFLSGGQSETEATEHLNAMNAMGDCPWALSFSYGRALQQSALRAWGGDNANLETTYATFYHRAEMNSKACHGEYSPELEI